MEKIVVLLWKPEPVAADDFRQTLLETVGGSLSAAGARRLRVCVADSAVTAAAAYRIDSTYGPYDGMLGFWVDSANYPERWLSCISPHVAGLAAYLVTESEPIVNREFPADDDGRTPGMNQVVALQKPDRLSHAEWREIWQQKHTQVAIDIQSTFGYRQNVVVRALAPDQPPFTAVVEENFPPAAMTDRMAFYDAPGDEALYKAREQQMLESAMRFIDFDRIDCIPMSQYELADR